MASSTDPSKVKLFSLCPWERCPSCSQLLWGSSCQLPLLPPFPQEAGCPWGLVQRDLAAAEERGGEDVPPKEPPPRVTQHLAAHLWDTSGCSPSPQSLLEGGTCSKVRDFWGWEGWGSPWREGEGQQVLWGFLQCSQKSLLDWKCVFSLCYLALSPPGAGVGNQQGRRDVLGLK